MAGTMGKIREGTLGDVLRLHERIPELAPPRGIAAYQERIGGRARVILIAEQAGTPAGFKLGYAIDDAVFYSWIGGVLPEYRGRGIAKNLLIRQERIVGKRGFRTIEVKSMNRYPGMLHLLLSQGYVVAGYEAKNGPHEAKILFMKSLA